jgi:hypothetical protein
MTVSYIKKERKCVAEVKNYKDMEEVYMDI